MWPEVTIEFLWIEDIFYWHLGTNFDILILEAVDGWKNKELHLTKSDLEIIIIQNEGKKGLRGFTSISGFPGGDILRKAEKKTFKPHFTERSMRQNMFREA